MNIKEAANATMDILENRNNNLPHNHPWYGRDHIAFMLNQISIGEVTGEQAHRWLGWAQCAICFSDGATLEELKHINHDA